MSKTLRMLVPALAFFAAAAAHGQITRTATLTCNGVTGTTTATLFWHDGNGVVGNSTPFTCDAGTGSVDVEVVTQPDSAFIFSLEWTAFGDGSSCPIFQDGFSAGHPEHSHDRCVTSTGVLVFTIKN